MYIYIYIYVKKGSNISFMDVELKFKHLLTCTVTGPTGSGKFSFCIKFLKNLKTQCTESKFS